jgi:hypothetical protein
VVGAQPHDLVLTLGLDGSAFAAVAPVLPDGSFAMPPVPRGRYKLVMIRDNAPLEDSEVHTTGTDRNIHVVIDRGSASLAVIARSADLVAPTMAFVVLLDGPAPAHPTAGAIRGKGFGNVQATRSAQALLADRSTLQPDDLVARLDHAGTATTVCAFGMTEQMAIDVLKHPEGVVDTPVACVARPKGASTVTIDLPPLRRVGPPHP